MTQARYGSDEVDHSLSASRYTNVGRGSMQSGTLAAAGVEQLSIRDSSGTDPEPWRGRCRVRTALVELDILRVIDTPEATRVRYSVRQPS